MLVLSAKRRKIMLINSESHRMMCVAAVLYRWQCGQVVAYAYSWYNHHFHPPPPSLPQSTGVQRNKQMIFREQGAWLVTIAIDLLSHWII